MPDKIHSYVDEAGDPTLFGCKRGSGVIVGNDGCSNFFSMGKLEVVDPECISQKLTALRHELLTDPYFANVESFKPERPKIAHGFHAHNDLSEVRYRVFKLFREIAPNLRSHVVAPGKKDLHGDFSAYCYIGFRHSFCHGWAGGPAAWLGKNVLGVPPSHPTVHKLGFLQISATPRVPKEPIPRRSGRSTSATTSRPMVLSRISFELTLVTTSYHLQGPPSRTPPKPFD